MKTFVVTALFSAICVLSSTACYADDPKIENVCVKNATGTSEVRVSKFLWWAFNERKESAHKVSHPCVDRNDEDSETTADFVYLLTDDEADYKKCKPNDAGAVAEIKYYITDFLSRPPKGFSVVRNAPSQNGGDDVVDFLKGSHSLTVACSTEPQGTDPPQVPDGKRGAEKITGLKLRLRGDQKSLPYENGSDEYKKLATAANISATDDELNRKTRINTKGALGIDIPTNTEKLKLLPYVQWEDQFNKPLVAKPKTAQDKEINTVVLGSLTSFDTWSYGDRVSSVVTFDPQYVIDNELGSRLFATTFMITPTLSLDGGANTFPAGNVPIAKLLYAHFYASGVVRVGEVLDEGMDTKLATTGNFLYYGPEGRLVFTGYEGSIFEPFKLDLTYNHLWGEGISNIVVERFLSTLSYSLDVQQNFQISLTYDNGVDYDTFKERRMLSTSLGYKF